MKNHLLKLTEIMKQHFMFDISMFDQSFIEKTVLISMRKLKIDSIENYISILENNEEESKYLQEALHNHYSEFFRNSLTYSHLEKIIIPRLFELKKANNEKEIRVWSAACASGQEAYSIAMLFDEYIKKTKTNIRYRIFATDVCSEEIERARRGIYKSKSIGKLSFERVQNYFEKKGDNYSILPDIKSKVDFSVFDLLNEHLTAPPASIFGNFDMVFCSNILFYYKIEQQKTIIKKLSSCQASGAYIITGEAERDILKSNNYRELFVNSSVFQIE